MSKKSHPGDGVRNQGVKGGTLYGVHFGGGANSLPGPSRFSSRYYGLSGRSVGLSGSES
ncbi:MAG: lariocidin/triculamin family lasso peptide core domain [Actinomycetota bacterium]